MNPSIQTLAELLGVTEPINGTWIQAITETLPNESELTPDGDYVKFLCNLLGVTESVNGTWIQALAESEYNQTEPINGTWLQSIIYSLESDLYVVDGYYEEGYAES
jgi:predicted small secreted protein